MPKPLSVSLSTTEKIIIEPIVEHFDENSQICAINWFNLKSAWMYRLYGLLAARFVVKVSGKLCFMGKLIRRLEGPADQQREKLLIVCYPGARSFLRLIEYRIFRLISVFRIAAVRQFCFGFTENILEKTDSAAATAEKSPGHQIYLVHHFQGGGNWLREKRQTLFAVARRHRLDICFCGLATAHLVREKFQHRQRSEFPMDGILVFAVHPEAELEKLIEGDAYRAFMQKNTSDSLYLFSGSH